MIIGPDGEEIEVEKGEVQESEAVPETEEDVEKEMEARGGVGEDELGETAGEEMEEEEEEEESSESEEEEKKSGIGKDDD